MESHRQVTQHHYDLHAQQQQQKTTAQVLKERQEGPAAPLKKFHNEIKRRLIYRFGYQADALIDYACGRGGDIQKWDAAQIGYVLGLDISGAEIQEAQRRFGELKAKRGSASRLQAEFQQIGSLAAEHFEAPRQFDVATCMFAMHYFFDKPEALKTLLGSIAANLKPGGFFIGCVPDGKRVKAHLAKSSGLLEQPHLRLKAISKPPFEAFGATYVMEIPDTVVEGHQGFTEGSEEYMVFEKVLLAEAGKAGLFPVLEYGDAAVDALFQQADEKKAMKHFAPKYPEGSDASLSTASEIYMAFVFQKVPSAGEAQAPPLPPPERKEAGGFRAGGGGRGGFGAGGQQRQQGGRGGGNDKMSSITWNLPYAANYLPPNNMPIVYHNVRPGGLQQRSEAGRWIIWPPPMPAFPGPVQFTEDGREVLQHLPNGYPIHNYGQELEYWRQQQQQHEQQQQHGMSMPPQQPPQHQRQHGHCGMGHAPNGMQQQGQAQYPQPPAEPSGGAAAGGGGRGARGGRGGGRKGAGAAAATAAGDGDDASQAGGRGRGRGGGRGSRGGRTAGSKRDRPAEAEAAGQDPAGGECDAAADEQHTPAIKKQAVEAAAPNGGNAGTAAAAEDPVAAAAAADSVAADCSAPAAAMPAAAAAPVSRAPQSAGAKLARVKAADPLEYKERQEPAPLSPDFLEAMIQQAPPYADS